MDIKEIAITLKDKLKKYQHFKGLYLYGSQVKGTAKDNSDIDIALIFEKRPDYLTKDQMVGDILDIELEQDVVIDYKFTTPEELNFNSFFFNELKKGLYYGV